MTERSFNINTIYIFFMSRYFQTSVWINPL